MAAIYTGGNQLTITFENDDWKDIFPNIYQVTEESSIPWYSNSANTYLDKNSLRSGAIGHSGSSYFSLKFNLIESGTFKFNYLVSSESTHDKIVVTIDGTTVLNGSGQNETWKDIVTDLSSGQHTVKFTYSKDSSVSSGQDLASIGYIELTGITPNWNKYYLLQDLSDFNYYTIENGSLKSLGQIELTLSNFQQYGVTEKPTTPLLSGFKKYKVLMCTDTVEHFDLISCSVTLDGVLNGVCKIKEPFVLDPSYQESFNSIKMAFDKLDTTEIRVAISTDNITYYTFKDNIWGEINLSYDGISINGIELSVLQAMTTSNFDLLYHGITNKKMFIAFVAIGQVKDNWILKEATVKYNIKE